MNREEFREIIHEAVREAITCHACAFSDEERLLMKDMANGARLAKTWTIRAVVFGVMIAAAGVVWKATTLFHR